MDAEKKDQLIAELVTTALVLLFYWISIQPAWKLEMYVNKVMERFRLIRHTSPVVSLEHAETLRKFRQEISEWEHNENHGS